MKKLLLSCFLLLSYTFIQAQIIVYVETPPAVTGNYDFTWADPIGGWGTADLNNPANAVRDTLMLVDDGTAADSLGCNILINNLTGKIAVVYRGSCEFGVKAKNAQDAGAVGVIIINNIAGAPAGMAPGSQGANVTIPVVMVSDVDGVALHAELNAGSDIVAFIGNKIGIFNNDIGIQAIDMLISRATANPKNVSLSATEFNVPLGAWIHNYGINNQTNVTLTVAITGAGNYSATSSPVSIVSGDTVYVSVPAYSAASYSGLYHVNYTVNSGVTDDFIADNAFYSGFLIDSLASYAFIDSLSEMPVSSAHYRVNPSPTIFENCIHFRDANASRIKAMGLYASGSGGAGGTMAGEYLEARIFEWNNVFTGLSDPAFPASPWTLNEVRFGSYTYSADLDGEMVYIPFADSLILTDDQRYLFCVRTYSPDVYLGFDTYYNYNEVVKYYDQPVSIVIADADQYPTGFGTGTTSSVSVLFGSGNGPLTASISINSAPFCSPACDGSATVTASLGIPPYTYLWNDPLAQTTATATGLCNGTFMVIVSDNAGAVDTLSVTLSPPGTPPSFTISATQVEMCNGDSAWLTASSVSQGIYVWSTGDSTQTIGVDSIGTYTVAVTYCGGTTVDSITIATSTTPPAFTISATQVEMCNGDSTWITANSVIPGSYSYIWSTGATTQTIGIDTVGTYTVAVTNCVGTTVDSIAITLALATPTATVLGNIPFCPGDSIMLTGETQPSGVYTWSTGDTAQSIYVDTVGVYTLIVTDCGVADTASVTTSFEPLPTVTVSTTGATEFCDGGTIGLTASGGASYIWSNGISSSSITLNSPSQSGDYWVTAYNVCGDSAISDTTTVTIHPLPPVPTISSTGITFCTGDSATLTSSAAMGNQWYRNGILISTGGTNQTYAATQSGNYTVTVTDNNGCSAFSDTVTLTVSATPSPYVTITGSTTFCEGDSVILTSTYADSYLWSPGGDTTQSIAVYSSGDYFVNVTNTDLCDGIGDSPSILVTVYPIPQTSAIIGTTNVSEFSTSIYSVSYNASSIYYWSVFGGNQINGGQTNSIEIQWGTSGTGRINVVETDSVGCFGDTVNLIVDISTGINENGFEGEIIHISPNPSVDGQFVIELNNVKNENYLIEVRNIIGQLILSSYAGRYGQSNFSGDHLKIDPKGFSTFRVNLSEQNPGVYVLNVSGYSGTRTAKLIVY